MTVLDRSSNGDAIATADYATGVPANAPLSRPAGVAYVVATLIGWASVLLFLKYLAGAIDAWTANGWRYGLSALMWSPLLMRSIRSSTLPRDLPRRAIMPALFNTAGQICFGLAPYYIGPGFGAFLIRISVVTAIAGALILFADERVLLRQPLFWIGLAMVVCGSTGTVLFRAESLGRATAIGVALGLASGLCYGMYSVSVRYYMHGVPSMVSFAWISFYTAVALIVLMLVFGDGRGGAVFRLSGFGWAMLCLSALVGIAVGHVFYYSAIARLGVAISNGVLQVAPFLTAVGSYFLFGESLTHQQWLCGAVLFAGALLLLRAEQSRRTLLAAGD